MAFIIGNASAGSTGFAVPPFTTATRPGSPVEGQIIYNTTNQLLEVYANGSWRKVDNNAVSSGFLYRQIITNSYVMGGYKDSSPWRNVNRMVHATDICTNLGDLLTYSVAYTSGACSLTKGFIWACNVFGAGTITCAINLATETTAGTNSVWDMKNSRDQMGTGFQETQYAYITGGGTSAFDIFNMTSETMLNSTISASFVGGASSAISDEKSCYFWGDSGTPTKLSFNTHTFNYSGMTQPLDPNIGEADYLKTAIRQPQYGGGFPNSLGTTNLNLAPGCYGQQKGISSKLGKGYGGNEGSYNGGYNLRRFVFSTETYTTVAKPIGNSGEENFDMGQDHQYMMGCYDGAQNNRGWRFSYTTDTGVELSTGSLRTGVPGGSSAHCVWK
jgi:hypothetical protein